MSYDEIRKYLELIYFISGPIIAGGVVIAFFQYLKFAKDIKTKYGREVSRQAINDITIFNQIVIPQYKLYGDELKHRTMPFAFDGNITDLNNKDLIKAAESFSANISEKARRESMELIIELNRLSLSFEFGISDEKMTYDIIGRRLIKIFQNLSFMAVLLIHEGTNLTALFNTYKKWKNWADLEDEKKDLLAKEERIAKLEIMAKEPTKPISM